MRVFEMLEIWVQVDAPSVEDSHLTTEPAFPLRVSVPLFELAHAVVTCGEIEPPLGEGITVTNTVVVFEQPFPSVPVTEYVVVVDVPATTVAPVVDDNPVEGLHE